MEQIKVFSPATVANVACGFDIFGFALEFPGDEIIAKKNLNSGVQIACITGDQKKLPLDPKKNVASVVVFHLLKKLQLDVGISLEIHKKMPLSSGLGSSAASSVGALFAVNHLLGNPLTKKELLPFALMGEKLACGSAHADNVAPCLFGGFTLIRSYNPLDVIKIPIKVKLACVVLTPQVELQTRDQRKYLPEKVTLNQLVAQSANASGLIAALMMGDVSLLERSLQDVVVEKVRAPLIPYFEEIRHAALKANAIGCHISGSGPSIFALCDEKELEKVGRAMQKACACQSHLYLTSINEQGPYVLS